MTQCPVCLDVYKDPRMLTSCGHSVCADCLEELINASSSRISVKCPKCREWSRVPLSGFPKNYDLAGRHCSKFKFWGHLLDAIASSDRGSETQQTEEVSCSASTGLGCNACQKEVAQSDKLYECRTCAEALGTSGVRYQKLVPFLIYNTFRTASYFAPIARCPGTARTMSVCTR